MVSEFRGAKLIRPDLLGAAWSLFLDLDFINFLCYAGEMLKAKDESPAVPIRLEALGLMMQGLGEKLISLLKEGKDESKGY